MNTGTVHAGGGARAGWRRGLFTALAFLVLAAALGACAATEVAPGEPVQPGPEEGLVVLSITHSGQRGMDLLVNLEAGAGGTDRTILMPRQARARDWLGAPGLGPTPEADPEGKLLVLRLKPGPYRLHYWKGVSELGGLHGIGFEIHSAPIEVGFTAAAGRVTYVGNVHLALPDKLNYMANQTPSTYRLELTDRSQRDLARLEARHPGAQAGSVQMQLAQSPQAGTDVRYYIFNYSDSDEPPLQF